MHYFLGRLDFCFATPQILIEVMRKFIEHALHKLKPCYFFYCCSLFLFEFFNNGESFIYPGLINGVSFSNAAFYWIWIRTLFLYEKQISRLWRGHYGIIFSWVMQVCNFLVMLSFEMQVKCRKTYVFLSALAQIVNVFLFISQIRILFPV